MVIKFPPERCVPPPDLDGIVRDRTTATNIRAVLRPGVRRPPIAHAFFVVASPHEPTAPRTLVFANITPAPGESSEPAASATGVRAIPLAGARRSARERNYYSPREPRPAIAPHAIQFAEPIKPS